MFAGGIAIVSAVIIGAIPALRDSATGSAIGSREHARGVMGARSSKRIRNVLAVAEITLAVVLASGAGVLVRSLWRLEHVKPGFDAEQVLTARVTLPANRVPPALRVQRHEEILEALQTSA